MLMSCDGLFFQPDRVRYVTPQRYGLAFEPVRFRSGDGTLLSGWFLPARGRALGTVLHFHGNAANISNHIHAVRWLPDAGYAVFLFDYRGYGESEGSPTRAGAVADGLAALAAVRARPDVDPERLIVYGQSLGGALAVATLAQAERRGIRAVVLEATFASYREVARLILDRFWLTWPLQYPLAYGLISEELGPRENLAPLAPLPLLAIHGEADGTVPIAAGRALFDAFPGADKEFWSVPGAGHMQVFENPNSPWRGRLLDYLAARLGKA
jgi:fermentation-respiration switch protein FrsA (DUF1100 family)